VRVRKWTAKNAFVFARRLILANDDNLFVWESFACGWVGGCVLVHVCVTGAHAQGQIRRVGACVRAGALVNATDFDHDDHLTPCECVHVHVRAHMSRSCSLEYVPFLRGGRCVQTD